MPRHRAAALAASQSWTILHRFSQRWQDEASLLHAWVPFVFLEFDAAAAADAVPMPSLFASLDWPATAQGDPQHEVAIAAALLAELLEPLAARAARAAIAPHIAALAPQGRLLHLGVMLARPDAPLRLSVSLPRAVLAAHLVAIGFPGDVGAVVALLDEIEPGRARAHVEYDVGEAVGARLGLVVAASPGDRDGRRAVLERLRRRGLCTAATAAAVLAWDDAGVPGGPLRRTVSHLKVVVRGSQPDQVKAYLTAHDAAAGA